MRTLYTFEKDGQEFYADDAADDERAVEQVNERLKDEADEDEEPVRLTAADITKREEMPDWSDFLEKYRPVPHGHDGGGHPFYIYDGLIPEQAERIEEALVLTPANVWTVTHGDSDIWSIAPGVHPVNRVGVLITEVACADESEEYLY